MRPAGIELATSGSAVRLASVARHVTDCATRPGQQFCDEQTYEQIQEGNIHARVKVIVHDTSSEGALQMYESKIGCKDQESIQSSTTPGPGFVEIYLTVINNFVTSRPTNRCKGEIYMQELKLLCMTRRLTVLYKCINIR